VTAEELARQDEHDVRFVLHTREGARFLARLVDFAGVFRTSFVQADALTTAFKEGQRNAGLMVWGAALMADQTAPATLTRAAGEREVTQ